MREANFALCHISRFNGAGCAACAPLVLVVLVVALLASLLLTGLQSGALDAEAHGGLDAPIGFHTVCSQTRPRIKTGPRIKRGLASNGASHTRGLAPAARRHQVGTYLAGNPPDRTAAWFTSCLVTGSGLIIEAGSAGRASRQTKHVGKQSKPANKASRQTKQAGKQRDTREAKQSHGH